MLTIRKEQVAVFDKVALGEFEAETLEHLKEFTPKHSERLGDVGLRQVLRLGLEGSKKYGFTNRGPVRLYLECMFLLGSYFDQDPQFPWAIDILIDCQYSGQMTRAEALCKKTNHYVRKVFGPDRQHYREGVGRMDQLVGASASSGPGVEDALIEPLKNIFPQKCEYLGDAYLQKLVQWGIQSAKLLGLSTGKDISLFTCLGFMLGHGFATDPQFPWISATMKNTAAGTLNARVEQVYKQAQDYLQQTLV